jgi:hypothetical protein
MDFTSFKDTHFGSHLKISKRTVTRPPDLLTQAGFTKKEMIKIDYQEEEMKMKLN